MTLFFVAVGFVYWVRGVSAARRRRPGVSRSDRRGGRISVRPDHAEFVLVTTGHKRKGPKASVRGSSGSVCYLPAPCPARLRRCLLGRASARKNGGWEGPTRLAAVHMGILARSNVKRVWSKATHATNGPGCRRLASPEPEVVSWKKRLARPVGRGAGRAAGVFCRVRVSDFKRPSIALGVGTVPKSVNRRNPISEMARAPRPGTRMDVPSH